MSLLQITKEDYYTDIMKRYGPKDVSYAILWDAKDHHLVKIDNIFDECEKRWNDHYQARINGIEPLALSKSEDIVTFPGLAYCLRFHIQGSLPARFTFMCVGSGLDKASPFQQLLINEASQRGNMTLTGSMTRSGNNILRFANTFPASFETITVRESGVNTLSVPNTGTLLNRNVFSSTPITHTSGGTAFTVATDITFTPVTTWG